MPGSRALTRRVKRMKGVKPKSSVIAVWYGSFDAWVEQAVLPGVESGALEPDDMVEIVAALRDSTAVAYGPLMCDVLTETGSFRCPLIA